MSYLKLTVFAAAHARGVYKRYRPQKNDGIIIQMQLMQILIYFNYK